MAQSGLPASKGEQQNFLQSYYDLKLPRKKVPSKAAGLRQLSSSNLSKSRPPSGAQSKGKSSLRKKEVTTDFDVNNKRHMSEKIELSDFRGKNFTRAGFREFLEGIEDMRCLSTVVLRNNGIDDEYIEELEMLLSNERLKKIDLSNNDIGKQGALAIARKLREVSHIEWIE